MKPSIERKLEQLMGRFEEIEALMADPATQSDQDQFRSLGQEYAQIEPIVLKFREYLECIADLAANKEMMEEEDDAEMREMAKDEYQDGLKAQKALEDELEILLLPKDPNDHSNIFLEIRAGTGGAEAAIFSGDLLRMYLRFAESKKWKVEILSESEGDHGGYKEVICRVVGQDIYSQLKFESGAHRVQRVPETESQGRVHTSACTVAILPEIEITSEIEIKSSDLRVDTFRASGAGGQHVNKTDSAVRLTHIPTGVVVECQDERSQHKNKARAMSLLQSRLVTAEQEKQHEEQSTNRRNLVGSGDRSERIRTYNYPQGRITDHRINLTLYKLDEIMQGALVQVIDPLIREHQTDLLASMAED